MYGSYQMSKCYIKCTCGHITWIPLNNFACDIWNLNVNGTDLLSICLGTYSIGPNKFVTQKALCKCFKSLLYCPTCTCTEVRFYTQDSMLFQAFQLEYTRVLAFMYTFPEWNAPVVFSPLTFINCQICNQSDATIHADNVTYKLTIKQVWITGWLQQNVVLLNIMLHTFDAGDSLCHDIDSLLPPPHRRCRRVLLTTDQKPQN